MDDAVQSRCAGYVQAEIERYAEELEQEADDHSESDGDDTVQGESDSEDDEGRSGAKPKKAKKVKKAKAKAKKAVEKEGTPGPNSFLFESLIITSINRVATCRSIGSISTYARKGVYLLLRGFDIPSRNTYGRGRCPAFGRSFDTLWSPGLYF